MEPATASYSVPSVHFLMIGVPFTCHSSPSWFPKKVDHLTPTSVHKHKVSQSTEVPLQTSVFYLNLLPIRAQVVDTEAKKKPLHTSTVSFVHLPPAAPEASWEMESFHRVLAHYQGFHQPVVLDTPPKERSGIIQHVQ